MVLDCVCSARLIRTRIIVYSVSLHCYYHSLTTQAAVTAHPLEFEASITENVQILKGFTAGPSSYVE